MRLILLSIAVLLLLQPTIKAQDADFIESSEITWYSLEEAQKLAKENNKKVLLFGDAQWCTYCKKMKKEVYPQEGVIEVIGDLFYPAILDTESEDEITFNGETFQQWELARAFKLNGTPTHYFFDSDGTILGQQPGFLPADIFERLLSFIGTNSFKTVSFDDYEYKGTKLSDEEGEGR